MKIRITSYVLLLFILVSCVSTEFLVNPKYGVSFNDKDSIVIYSLDQFGSHDYKLEQKTIDALSHCNMKIISYKTVEQLL